jgi:myo-inositol-1(or 4)-monophosphatase
MIKTNTIVDKLPKIVDKAIFLTESLNVFMDSSLAEIDLLVSRYPKANVQLKPDGSPVTELDLFISSHIELLMKKFAPEFNFYSEENYSVWQFPLIALDPLDGTREYIDGRHEWAISIGIFETENFSGQGWVYNPMTKVVFSGIKEHIFSIKKMYRGEVSRFEWNKGLFNSKLCHQFNLKPMGSIAYKLGRLSHGESDFVVSLLPKNIWDIAGGTLLCQQSGIKFYSQGKEVTSVEKIYLPPLIWCHEDLFSELSKIYF